MGNYTFAIPVNGNWVNSSKVFNTKFDAVSAMSNYLAAAAVNDFPVDARIVDLSETELFTASQEEIDQAAIDMVTHRSINNEDNSPVRNSFSESLRQALYDN